MENLKSIHKKISNEAISNYSIIVKKFKANNKINHKILLSHGFSIIYGVTIKQAQVVFPNGNEMDIWDFINGEL